MVSTEKKIVNIYWPLVTSTTIVLYALIIICFPFSTQMATIILFALIAYWSRIPGVGIASPFFILYHADFVDMFSLLISLNIGPVPGAIFSVFGNVWSRIAGFTPPWGKTVIKDTGFQVITCLMSPFLYELFNHDILMTMMAYTILRRLGFFIVYFIIHDISPTEFVILWTGATSASAFVNFIYAKYFGNYLDGLLKSGVSFNWGLFIFATALILLCWLYVKNSSGTPTTKVTTGRFEGWIKLRMYLFFDSLKMTSLKKAVLAKEDNSDPFPLKIKSNDLKFEFTEIRNPEDVVLDFFVMSNDEGILKGSFKRFKIHVFMFLFFFVGLRCLMESYIPGILDLFLFIIIGCTSLYLMIYSVKNFIPLIIKLLG